MDIRNEIKFLAKQIKKIDDVEMHKRILDVQAEILIMQEENKKLSEENSSLKEEVSQLKEKLKITHSIKLENSLYWVPDSKGDKSGPYCPNCWSTRQVLVRMTKDSVRNRSYNKCPECMIVIMVKE